MASLEIPYFEACCDGLAYGHYYESFLSTCDSNPAHTHTPTHTQMQTQAPDLSYKMYLLYLYCFQLSTHSSTSIQISNRHHLFGDEFFNETFHSFKFTV